MERAFAKKRTLFPKAIFVLGRDVGILNIEVFDWDLSPPKNKQLSSLSQSWVWKYL